MNFKIHRGTKEIGGSCVEVWTESTRIVVDFGMPLVNPDQTKFDSRAIKNLAANELMAKHLQDFVLPTHNKTRIMDIV